MSDQYDYLFKVVVVGDGGVGKTALTLRFSRDFFDESYKMTIGVDFHVKTIEVETNEGPIRAKLQLWDTGGQERFSSIRPMYYRGSLGAVLVFDLTNPTSFEHLPKWIEEIRANVKADIPILLVGNKSDLVNERAVFLDEINEFTRIFNLYYMETSAKTGEGVGDCFYILACLMIGQGVPEKLLANETVYGPGRITGASKGVSLEEEMLEDYAAPPVPEPSSISTIESNLPNDQIDTVSEYEAPPVPEPNLAENVEKAMPEQSELRFKPPDEILAEQAFKEEEKEAPPLYFSGTKEVESERYKPKAVPFTTSTPTPAPPPEEFAPRDVNQIPPPSSTITPFRVAKKEEPPKPRPVSDIFNLDKGETPQEKPSISPLTPSVETESTVILSKKDKKKLEKEKKKKKKEEKLKEEKEKQEKMLEQMKKSKKEKKKKDKSKKEEILPQVPSFDQIVTSSAETQTKGSLFETLTSKVEQRETSPASPFVQFRAEEKVEKEHKTSLRIIPNEPEEPSTASDFVVLTSDTTPSSTPGAKSTKICKNCGAVLSSDYVFCNKCGSKL